jgi:imidazoleglycerol-phosphate dehydratase/histidinol-phosphatase
MNREKLLIIDRDGTLICEPSDFQIDSFAKLQFIPEVITWLGRIVRELDYTLIMATNQDGLGTSSFPEETFWGPHNFILKTFENEGIYFSEVLIDSSFEHEGKDTRKPGIGMFSKYLNGQFDLQNSYVIGDRLTDLQLATNLGAKSIFFSANSDDRAALSTNYWKKIYQFLKGERKASVVRKTNETDISVTVNLDNEGESQISTGIGFFDHMLQQIARHAGIQLTILCNGDLQVDEHHTVEDVAIALGEAINVALGNKRGIARYGFSLPMDESYAQVLIDLGGRPFFIWKCKFKRERIGDLPTELISHFFISISYSLKANIHIKAKGANEHHKAEAIFKAFAKSLKQAIAVDGENLPTTKGII